MEGELGKVLPVQGKCTCTCMEHNTCTCTCTCSTELKVAPSNRGETP